MAQPKRILWLVAGLAIVAIVVFATSGSDRSSPADVAQSAVDAFNDEKPGGIASFACADTSTDPGQVDLKGSVAEVRDVVMAGDHKATADLRFTDPTGDVYLDLRMDLAEKHAEWCVSSFQGWV